MVNAVEKLQYYKNNMSEFAKSSPEAVRAFGQLHRAASKPGALDNKTTELICIGIAVANRCEPCILAHMDLAVQAGVTREELAEALNSALLMCGGPAWAYSGFALSAYDELAAAKQAEK